MYIDPAAGSLILQVIAAAALSVFAFVGRARRKTREFFTSFRSRRRE